MIKNCEMQKTGKDQRKKEKERKRKMKKEKGGGEIVDVPTD